MVLVCLSYSSLAFFAKQTQICAPSHCELSPFLNLIDDFPYSCLYSNIIIDSGVSVKYCNKYRHATFTECTQMVFTCIVTPQRPLGAKRDAVCFIMQCKFKTILQKNQLMLNKS